MENELREKLELQEYADLSTMLANMDVFSSNVSRAIRNKYPELFSLNQDVAKVDLTVEEKESLLNWLENDLGPVIDDYKDAIEFLKSDSKAETEEQIKMMLDLEHKIDTQEYYWNAKHRGKGFAYKLIRNLIANK